MKGIVWYETFQQGCDQLNSIIEEYKYMNIKIAKAIKHRNYYEVQFENEDNWLLAPITENSRGRACNIAYIPYSLRNTEIENILIFPCIKKRPYRAFNYY